MDVMFKKCTALALMLFMLLTGCSAGNASGSGGLKDSATLQEIVDKIDTEIGIQMPSELDEQTLQDLFGVKKEDVEEFYGKFAMVMNSSDNVIAIKAKDGKAEDVKAALEKRKEDVIQSFEQYLPDQYEKAQKGLVITKGNYVFLVIVGEAEQIDQDMNKAKEIVDSYFS